jgi:uracil phosphoribosyltransferase
LNELPYSPKKVETPAGYKYEGLEVATKVCAVEIVRAGGAMRTSFSRIFVDAPIGKVLIQTSDIGEPLVEQKPEFADDSYISSNCPRILVVIMSF